MLKKTTFQRAHGNVKVKINNNEINRFYQAGSAKVFYPKSSQKFKELVLVNTAGGITSGDNFSYDFEIVNKSKIFLTTQTAERAYKGFNEKAKIKISLTVSFHGYIRFETRFDLMKTISGKVYSTCRTGV